MTKQKRNFQFLYFTDFKWIDLGQKDYFKGEPKPNKVYTALDDGGLFYRVQLISEEAGISLEKDNSVNKERDTWSCEFVEISQKNLLDLNITLKDLKKMNKELSANPEGDVDAYVKDYIEQQKNRFATDEETFIEDDLAASLSELMSFDKDMYEVIVKVATYTSEALVSPSHIPLTDALGWNPKTGKISNVTQAAQSLEAYLNTNDIHGISLLDAMYSILIELIRIKKTTK